MKQENLILIHTIEYFTLVYFAASLICFLVFEFLNLSGGGTTGASIGLLVGVGFIAGERYRKMTGKAISSNERFRLALFSTIAAVIVSGIITPAIAFNFLSGGGYFEFLSFSLFGKQAPVFIVIFLGLILFTFLFLYFAYRERKRKNTTFDQDTQTFGLEVKPFIPDKKTLKLFHIGVVLMIVIFFLSYIFAPLMKPFNPELTKSDIDKAITLMQVNLPQKINDVLTLESVKKKGDEVFYTVKITDPAQSSDIRKSLFGSIYAEQNKADFRKTILKNENVAELLKYGYDVNYAMIDNKGKEIVTFSLNKNDLSSPKITIPESDNPHA